MKKSDLISKMKEELQNYQIGLHNISIDRYNILMQNCKRSYKKIELTGAVVSEKAIAENILVNGLQIIDKSRGMLSTVLPIRNVFSDCFLDYMGLSAFFKKGLRESYWNIIIAIPYFINYDGFEYFVGDLSEYFVGDLTGRFNIANNYLFNSVVSKEFIYGYYEIKMERDNRDFYNPCNDDIKFYENPCFYEKLDKENQQAVLRRFLKNRRRLLANLKLANDYNEFKMLFRTPRERDIINATRGQRKRLFYGKK